MIRPTWTGVTSRAGRGRPYAASMPGAAADEPVPPDGGARGRRGSLRGTHAPQDGAGTPAGFQRLWMPPRIAYLNGEGKPVGTDRGSGCPVRRIPKLTEPE